VWKCCKKLGFDSVPTVVVRTNDAAAVKALRLALNRVAEDAGWVKKNLREELKYLLEVDYELDLTGFDAPECQWRAKSPQLWRSKIPQFGGPVISRGVDRGLRFWPAGRDV
jgi:hypothetical protein